MDVADVTLYAPAGELLAEAHDPIEDLSLRPNAAKRRRRRRDWDLDEAALEYFGDWHTLLVRTALIRARGFEPEDRPKIGGPWDVVGHLRHLQHLDHEYTLTISLDGRNYINAIHETAKGGLHGAALTPRDVLAVPLLTASSAIILVHNHPSGDPSPSPDDIQMTRAIEGGADALGLHLLDHIIIGSTGRTSSMVELGHIK